MVREIVKSQCGILFEDDALERASIELEIDEDAATKTLDNIDALEPIYDQLKLNPLWWILEILPMTFTWQDASGKWQSTFGCVILKTMRERCARMLMFYFAR
jgi:hypothetical protein